MDREKLKSSLGSFLTLMCDLMLLNVLWLICSLPLITAGPSTCAMFACMLKIARDELGQPTFKTFFKAFRENFRNAFFYGLFVLAAAALVYTDFIFALAQEGAVKTVFLIVTGIVSAITLTFISYVFALQARYDNTFKGQIKNAFLLAFCAPGKTLLMWLIYALPAAMILLIPFETVAKIGFIFLMVGVSLPVYFNSRILRNIFDRLIKNEKEEIGDEQN